MKTGAIYSVNADEIEMGALYFSFSILFHKSNVSLIVVLRTRERLCTI